MFFVFFFGGGVAPIVAVLMNIRHYKRVSFWLIVAAGTIYIFGIIVFTAQVDLPLNDHTESWNPQSLPENWKETRDEWNNANSWRVFYSFVSFIMYICAFVIRSSQFCK